jgi:hypothetical protein
VITRDDLLRADDRERRRLLRDGHAIDAARLDDWEYRGISLGLPRFVERLTWSTFQKAFHRDPATGALRGWNVRVEQRGLDAESVAKRRGEEPFTFGHFEVVPLDPARCPRGLHTGLVLDYGRGGNPALDATALVRDPVVAVNEGSVDLLLGWTFLEIGPLRLGTPSFFTLERERPLTHRAAPPRAPRPQALAGRRGA